MIRRLLNAHALIAEYVEAFVQRDQSVRANEKMLRARCEQCVQQGLDKGQGSEVGNTGMVLFHSARNSGMPARP